MSEPRQALIAGAGIGGLAAALAYAPPPGPWAGRAGGLQAGDGNRGNRESWSTLIAPLSKKVRTLIGTVSLGRNMTISLSGG